MVGRPSRYVRMVSRLGRLGRVWECVSQSCRRDVVDVGKKSVERNY